MKGLTDMYVEHSGGGTDGRPQNPGSCHIHVRFASPAMELDYQDDPTVARQFAAAASRIGVIVSIDYDVAKGCPRLPCRRLWT